MKFPDGLIVMELRCVHRDTVVRTCLGEYLLLKVWVLGLINNVWQCYLYNCTNFERFSEVRRGVNEYLYSAVLY
jgi:hypothetical protein